MSTAATEESGEIIEKSKRPKDSAFKQQRLPAWQPVLTAGTVLPTFFIIGIAFIPVGIELLYFSDKVSEHIIDYTDCIRIDGTNKETCSDFLKTYSKKECKCIINFVLDKDFEKKVYMYYGLTNYYQNHRRYVKSRDDDQLIGRLSDDVSPDCAPFDYNNNKPIAPCGAIANSLFNDTLTLTSLDHGVVKLLNTGIAWPSDKEIKFRNPNGDLKTALKNFSRPKDWSVNLWELDPDNDGNNGFQNEDFIVWMRTAALSSFRKLYRRIDHSQIYFTQGLHRGKYTLHVTYRFPVSHFGGTKKMILSTTSLLGGKNPFLGIAYIVVGFICLLLGILILFIHIKCSKRTTEMINVIPNTSYS